jgi:hypothetical protein
VVAPRSGPPLHGLRRKRAPPDDGLRALICENLRGIDGDAVHWTPIETALTVSGVPDLEGCWRAVQVWPECKRATSWAIRISEFQVGWLRRRARAGGRTFVIVRRRGQSRGVAYDELWIYWGVDADVLRRRGLRSHPPLVRLEGGPARWDWDRVGRVLFG